MGNCIRSAFKKLRRKRRVEKNIVLLLVGLDNAGKTLVLNRIAGNDDQHVLPTMGFRTVSLKYKRYHVKIYDLGGSPQIRSIWPKYYSDVHGLIYVVDASDISRLTENRVILGELISHENISGKPLLLLANKQDLNGAIDELDLVENLDIERIANAMRCPTRVETCSCFYPVSKSEIRTQGIINGYKWLLDTVLKNYTFLNSRIKEQVHTNGAAKKSADSNLDTISNYSTHSDPFKPIHELLLCKESSTSSVNVQSEVSKGKSSLKKLFNYTNKTAPLALGYQMSVSQSALHRTECNTTLFQVQSFNQENVTILDPRKLDLKENGSRSKRDRPYTAPQSFQRDLSRETVLAMPGQVPT
ncbi:ADP-ribosylation factor-like protein 13B [Cephus cinctus]|uniref:ADP-ribosylation factor-like protein 13B n=1 Tax=Cephus cinctus TaxID=211228 RepID=A0AAJ7BMY4_CEPCN|nr:ADP-ribosylation factor-like protein 13B [Cephus cinctus]